MANASRDGNFVPAIIGVDSNDLVTPVKIAVDASTNRVLVNAVGSTLTQTTNQTVNLTQINGVTASVNKGASDAGTLRVSLGDGSQTIGSVTILGSLTTTLAANQTVNLIQINGVAASVDNGASGTGVLRVTLANNSTGVVGLNAGSNLVGSVQISGTPNTNLYVGGAAVTTSNAVPIQPPASGSLATNLVAGSALVGSVQVAGSLPAGSNNIGSVNIWSNRNILAYQQTSLYSTTSTVVIVTAAGSGVFADLYGITITNFAASVNKVKISDSDNNETVEIYEIPANDTRGFRLPYTSAIPQATSNKPWTAQCTSSGSIEITALYIKRSS